MGDLSEADVALREVARCAQEWKRNLSVRDDDGWRMSLVTGRIVRVEWVLVFIVSENEKVGRSRCGPWTRTGTEIKKVQIQRDEGGLGGAKSGLAVEKWSKEEQRWSL